MGCNNAGKMDYCTFCYLNNYMDNSTWYIRSSKDTADAKFLNKPTQIFTIWWQEKHYLGLVCDVLYLHLDVEVVGIKMVQPYVSIFTTTWKANKIKSIAESEFSNDKNKREQENKFKNLFAHKATLDQ